MATDAHRWAQIRIPGSTDRGLEAESWRLEYLPMPPRSVEAVWYPSTLLTLSPLEP